MMRGRGAKRGRAVGDARDIYVIDGNSLNRRLAGLPRRVRLYGIDAPELEQAAERKRRMR